MKNKQIIKCNVINCKYNNQLDNLCNLHSVSISSTITNTQCKNRSDTICKSFEIKE